MNPIVTTKHSLLLLGRLGAIVACLMVGGCTDADPPTGPCDPEPDAAKRGYCIAFTGDTTRPKPQTDDSSPENWQPFLSQLCMRGGFTTNAKGEEKFEDGSSTITISLCIGAAQFAESRSFAIAPVEPGADLADGSAALQLVAEENITCTHHQTPTGPISQPPVDACHPSATRTLRALSGTVDCNRSGDGFGCRFRAERFDDPTDASRFMIASAWFHKLDPF